MLRFQILKNISVLGCTWASAGTILTPNHISSNLEHFSKIVRIGISDKVDMNFTKSDISESAKLFLALNSCPSFFEQVTYVTINAIGTFCISLIKSKLTRKKLNHPLLLLRQP